MTAKLLNSYLVEARISIYCSVLSARTLKVRVSKNNLQERLPRPLPATDFPGVSGTAYCRLWGMRQRHDPWIMILDIEWRRKRERKMPFWLLRKEQSILDRHLDCTFAIVHQSKIG